MSELGRMSSNVPDIPVSNMRERIKDQDTHPAKSSIHRNAGGFRLGNSTIIIIIIVESPRPSKHIPVHAIMPKVSPKFKQTHLFPTK